MRPSVQFDAFLLLGFIFRVFTVVVYVKVVKICEEENHLPTKVRATGRFYDGLFSSSLVSFSSSRSYFFSLLFYLCGNRVKMSEKAFDGTKFNVVGIYTLSNSKARRNHHHRRHIYVI